MPIEKTVFRIKRSFKDFNGGKKYLFSTFWLFGERVLRVFSGLVIGAWVARYLGPEKYGVYSYIIALSAIFLSLSKMGLEGILTRELVSNVDKKKFLLGTAFWIRLFSSVLSSVLFTLTLFIFKENSEIIKYAFIITVSLLFQSFDIVESYFQSEVKGRVLSINKVIQLVLSGLTKVILIISNFELEYFIYVIAFDSILLAYSNMKSLKKDFINYNIFKFYHKNIAQKLIKDSWPLIFSSLMIMIYMRIDQLMIKHFLGTHYVGIFSASIKIVEATYFIPLILTSSLFPAIINAKKLSKILFIQRLSQLYTLLSWIAILFAIFINVFGYHIINTLFGESYSEAIPVIKIYSWGTIFIFLGVASGKYLLAENLTKIALARSILGVFSNVILNILLIPSYGLNGAAIATIVSQFLTNVLFDSFKKELHLQFILKLRAVFTPWITQYTLRTKTSLK